ncbi:MAG: GerMN domain-containing protein [Actinobacteria bacterium]|nr:GerMN domain-containing protein [Actinomycetota bacterium]
MKDSNKIEKGFIVSSKVPQLIIIGVILIIIITLFASGCSAGSSTNENNKQNNGQAIEDTSIAAESTSNTQSSSAKDSSTSQEASVTSEETGNNNSSNEEVTINVYYSDQSGEYLIGEARILSGSSKYVDAISEMMKEPIDGSLVKLIPESTKINSVTVKDGMAKVDLSKNFEDDRFVSDTMDILLIYTIVNTLTEFPDVNSVEFYIDGERLDVLGGLDLQGPLFRRSDLIKKD